MERRMKEHIWQMIRGLTHTRQMLVGIMSKNLMQEKGKVYLETDGYIGIIRTCEILSDKIREYEKELTEEKG